MAWRGMRDAINNEWRNTKGSAIPNQFFFACRIPAENQPSVASGFLTAFAGDDAGRFGMAG